MRDLTYRKIDFSDSYWMEKICRLRYDVYVRERSFFCADDCLNGLEVDEYDKQSSHFAVIDGDGQVVGTVRLILPGSLDFPLRKSCGFVRQEVGGERYAEVSRLILDKRLREGRGLRKQCAAHDYLWRGVPSRTRAFSCAAKCAMIGLCGLIFQESLRYGISHWYALMERSLWSLLRQYGLTFECIGEKIDVFGPVYPYLVDLNSIEQSMTNFSQRYDCPILANIEMSPQQPRLVGPYNSLGWLPVSP